MGSETKEPLPGGARSNEPHISFVQRLQRHFGGAVDPRITLQEEEDQVPGRAEPPSTATPGSVQELVKRLGSALELGSRYEIKSEVASGGMGTILRVWDEDLRRNLAMKVMHGRGVGSSTGQAQEVSTEVDPERLGRFLEEAQITGQLDHPGVVPVHDLGIDSRGRCYFTMRFVRGRELKEVLDLARAAREGWTRTKVLAVILKVCEAMAYAHSKGVVHRDLKPSNVMVGRFGETYVMDWGLARVLGRHDSHDMRLEPERQDASHHSLVRTARREESDANPESPLVTMDGDVIGTPSYMAPEQARGKLEEVGPRSDVYSLGAILYYMLTGQAPYVKPGERVSPHTVLARVLDGPPLSIEKLAPNEPAELVAICFKAMARDPERRYASMLEVADDIQAFLENRVVRAYERGSVAEFRKWVARNRGMAAGIAGMVTLSIASALGFAWQQKRQFDDLLQEENATREARDLAVQNEAKALASEKLARENSALAEQGRRDADEQAEIALRNEQLALRSGYVANILAADYSLKLNDLLEARERLRETDTRLRGWEWRHLNLRANQAALANLSTYNRGVEGLAFHPRANQAILLTSQGKVYVKDLATREDVEPHNIQLGTLDTIFSVLSNLALDVSADGTLLALAGSGSPRPGDERGVGTVQLFDLGTGERPPGVEVGGLPGHPVRTSAVAFSPSGRWLASGDDDGGILVRDTRTAEIQARLLGHLGRITSLAWSPSSERLASSSQDGTVRVWELEPGQESPVLTGHRGAVTGIAWDLLGHALFSCGEDGTVNRWEVATGRLVRSFTGHDGPVLALDYAPNADRLVTGSSDRTLRVWDAQSGSAVVLRGHVSAVTEVAFHPSGDLVLSAERDGTVYLWDAEGDLSSMDLAFHRAPVNALAFDPTGRRLVSASDDHDLVLWDAQTGEPLRRLREHENLVKSVVYSPDGHTLLSGSQDKTVRLWDAETGRLLKVFSGFEKWIECAIFTPDASRVIVGSGDRKVRVLDARTTEVLRELAGLKFPVRGLVLSPDGHQLAAVGRDIMIWDLRLDGEAALVRTLDGQYLCCAFSPDGARLAAGSRTGQVQLWEAASGERLNTPGKHGAAVNSLVFSPDGRRIASASSDGEIHVRDGGSGDTLLVLEGSGEGRGSVLSVAFSPDGNRIAAGLENGQVRIYETSPPEERRVLRREAAALREQARERVDALFAARFFADQVVLELESDLGLSRPLREAALRLAHLRGDDPGPLFATSLGECLDPERSAEDSALSLRRAEAAERMLGSSGSAVPWELRALGNLAKGAAAYRGAKYLDAVRDLERDLEPERQETDGSGRRVEFGKRERALRLLFLCMSQCQTERPQEAERSWKLAQQNVMNDAELSLRAELLGLLSEAETLVRSRATPQGS